MRPTAVFTVRLLIDNAEAGAPLGHVCRNKNAAVGIGEQKEIYNTVISCGREPTFYLPVPYDNQA